MKNNRSSNHIHQQADEDRQKPIRRRTKAEGVERDGPRHRRLAPYKREQVDYDADWQDEALGEEFE